MLAMTALRRLRQEDYKVKAPVETPRKKKKKNLSTMFPERSVPGKFLTCPVLVTFPNPDPDGHTDEETGLGA